VVNYVGRFCHAFVKLLLGSFSSECLATAAFVEAADKLFDSFNGVSCAVRGKELRRPLNNNSPHRSLDQSKYENKELGLSRGW
jgi:hypothetical protein